jgi:hypothetical protein
MAPREMIPNRYHRRAFCRERFCRNCASVLRTLVSFLQLLAPASVVSDQNFASHSPLKLRLFEPLNARGQLRRLNRARISLYDLA